MSLAAMVSVDLLSAIVWRCRATTTACDERRRVLQFNCGALTEGFLYNKCTLISETVAVNSRSCGMITVPNLWAHHSALLHCARELARLQWCAKPSCLFAASCCRVWREDSCICALSSTCIENNNVYLTITRLYRS